VSDHLEQLLAVADLGNPVDRGMLADLMEAHGRTKEADLLRSEGLVFLHEGQVKLSSLDRHRDLVGVAVAARVAGSTPLEVRRAVRSGRLLAVVGAGARGLLVSRADLSRL
jgi:hypothetical protein